MSAPKYPQHDEVRPVSRVVKPWSDVLEYCVLAALESCLDENLEYDAHKDELIYHHRIIQMDKDLFDLLKGVEEIWVITRAGVES